MMTRESSKILLAREALLMGEASGRTMLDGDATLAVIDEIYDDFESRTCESCRYAIKRGFMDKICDNESGIAYDVVVKTTDGCNKWATK
jgi:hypothetical protein